MGYVIDAFEDKSDESLLEYFIYPVWVFVDNSIDYTYCYLPPSLLNYGSSRIHQLAPSDDTSLGAVTRMYMTTLTDANTFFSTKEDALDKVRNILLKMSINNQHRDKDSVEHHDDISSNAQGIDISHSQTFTSTASLPEISW